MDIEKVKDGLKTLIKKEVSINIKEVKHPQADAQLAAENVATQLEKKGRFPPCDEKKSCKRR